jgi:hypothetical protein
MKTILVGECKVENTFELRDPDGMSESEFEYKVAKALICIYPDYHHVFPFTGSFAFEDRTYKPDIALVAKDFSHWFVIEVELLSHSLSGHVMPQVRSFRWGEPQTDCIVSLMRSTGREEGAIRTLLRAVPKAVAVIANKASYDWELSLAALDVQFLSASIFASQGGVEAVELTGQLEILESHIAFGKFSAIDGALRFARIVPIADGDIQISDPNGASARWIVTRDAEWAWVQKARGRPDIEDGNQIQLVRSIGGRLILKRPLTE